MHWVIFGLSGVGVIAGGIVLARAADRLSAATGIGHLWMGSIVVGAATSMPELVVDVSAVRVGAPELAVGDLLGSSMANMLVLALVDIVYRRRRVIQSTALEHTLTGALAISLTMLAALFLLVNPGFSLGLVGPGPVAIAVVYLLGARVLHRGRSAPAAGGQEAASEARPGWCGPAVAFGVATALILASGPFLAISANDIVDDTGMDGTFFGAAVLAIVTSLPELSASFAAVGLGATDLAVGNLFGSNAYNMLLLLPVDLAASGSLLDGVGQENAVAAVSAALMMSVALTSLILRAERRFALVVPDAVLLVGVYVMGLAFVWGAGDS